MKQVLITGASGLLGRSLVEAGEKRNLLILAQYHRKKSRVGRNCRWIQADFTDPESVRTFLNNNRDHLARCHYLINGYGPINPKAIPELIPEDFCHAFHHNTLTVVEMLRFMIPRGMLESVVSIGFENLDRIMPFRQVLPYAIAKNALLLITRSYARQYPGIRFNMVSPVTLTGAREKLKNGPRVSPRMAAEKIYDIMTGGRTGLNLTIP